jgi:hypothetical protein
LAILVGKAEWLGRQLFAATQTVWVASRRVVGIEHAILGDDQPAGVSSPVAALSLSTTV